MKTLKMVKCPNCGVEISPRWSFCPNCGNSVTGRVRIKEKRKRVEKKYGWKWCPTCQSNRQKSLWRYTDIGLGYTSYSCVECDYCIDCGTRLEEIFIEDSKKSAPTCPRCGEPSRKLAMMTVKIGRNPPTSMQTYQCKNPECTTFVIVKNKKHIVIPTASEF